MPQLAFTIVGAGDEKVIELNKRALNRLNPEKELVVVPSATHLFEKPGTLEEVARLANDWFLRFERRVEIRWRADRMRSLSRGAFVMV